MDAIRVVLDHNHPVVGAGVHILEEVRDLFEELAPDILLIEITRADEPGSTLARRAGLGPAAPRVFMLRGYQNRAYVFGMLTDESAAELTEYDALQTIAEAMRAGSAGEFARRNHRIVAKLPTRQLEDDPAAALDLTARETDVLQQLTTGKSDRDIGEHLGISDTTVHYHLKNIYRKLGVKRRSEAIDRVVRSGWME